jgi:hypothetical protein
MPLTRFLLINPFRPWVPIDPAYVRKVMLEEPPGNRPLDDEVVRKTRATVWILGR